jgi:hypothetical protein
MNPLSNFSDDEIITYAQALLRGALTHLELNEDTSPQAAAWRIADALGALSQICPDGTMGIHEMTGLGYKLLTSDDVTEVKRDDSQPVP